MLLITRLAVAIIALSAPATAHALPAGRPTAPQDGQSALVEPGSPRASVAAYLAAARAGDFNEAVRYLDRTVPRQRASELASRLLAVINTHLWIDLERISPRTLGDTADGLPRDRESLGEIAAEGRRAIPVRLAHEGSGAEARWVFSAGTVAMVDSIYAALPDHWVREHLPAVLLGAGPYALQWWQWLALITLIPIAALVGFLLAGPTQALLKRLVSRTETELDDVLVGSARGPIVLLIGVLSSRLLLRWIALPGPAEQFVVDLQRAIAIVAVFWILLRVIRVLQDALPSSDWGDSHPALRSIVPLVGRIARLLVIILGLLTVIATFGYPIATLLAGLGIGGIAVALGAQKSLEHFFGSVSIGIDQPFRVGDWVIIDGVEGEIEAIGLRSTRVRTLERTVVSMPNGRLADMRSENFGPRDRIRFRTEVALEFGTSAAQVAAVRDGIESMLRVHPRTWPDRIVVRLFRFAPSSIDLEVFCWVVTKDPDEFRVIREAHLLGIMRAVEQSGARFGFPTQTVIQRQGL